ncbi:MAG: hypothetical protein V1900_04025 [Candidatus Aenigmatarchaeota archaeon]
MKIGKIYEKSEIENNGFSFHRKTKQGGLVYSDGSLFCLFERAPKGLQLIARYHGELKRK